MFRTDSFLSMNAGDQADMEASWKWILTFGILISLLGVLALFMMGLATVVSVMALGGVMLVAGIIQVVQAFSAPKWGGLLLRLLVGILYSIVGLMLLFKPGAGAITLTWLLGFLFLAGGIFKIVVSLMARFEQWGWMAVSGAISLVLGLVILGEWPAGSLWIIGAFVGIDLLFDGVALIMLAMAVKGHHHERRGIRTGTPTPVR